MPVQTHAGFLRAIGDRFKARSFNSLAEVFAAFAGADDVFVA